MIGKTLRCALHEEETDYSRKFALETQRAYYKEVADLRTGLFRKARRSTYQAAQYGL